MSRHYPKVHCVTCGWKGERVYVAADDVMGAREGFGRCPCGGILIKRELWVPRSAKGPEQSEKKRMAKASTIAPQRFGRVW